MKRERIAILSRDTEYLDEISLSLAREIKKSVEIDLIDDDNYLHAFMQSAQKVSVLIIDIETVNPGQHQLMAEKVYYLGGESEQRIGHINKYDGVRGVLKKLDSNLLRDKTRKDTTFTQVIHTIGLCGSGGKTLVALGMSYALSSRGRSVLYLNADSLQDYMHEMGRSNDDYTSEALAIAIGQRGAVHTERLIEQFEKEEFYYHLPFRQMLSNYGLSEERIAQAAAELSRLNLYDDIIVEHPHGFSDATINVARTAEKIVFVGLQDSRSAERLERIVKGNIIDRNTCYLVCNRFIESEKDDLTSAANLENIPVCEYIPEIPNALPKDMVRNGHFRKLAEVMTIV